jgi:hypothetical protein
MRRRTTLLRAVTLAIPLAAAGCTSTATPAEQLTTFAGDLVRQVLAAFLL